MAVPAKIKAEVEAKLRACIKVAEEHYGQSFRFPTIHYTKRGTTAGTADVRAWAVNFNAVLLMENIEDFINRTVPHEMAHLVDYQMHPENFESKVSMTWSGRMKRTKRSVHGYTWKAIMMLFKAPVSRCHSYDTTNAKVKKARGAKHVYVCKTCGTEMKLGPVRHAKMHSGRSRYWMRGCGHHAGYEYRGLEGATKQVPVWDLLPKAADTASHKRPTAPTGSKLEKCRHLYIQHRSASRSGMIELFVRHAGCTAAGAATYYAKIKKELP